MDNITIFSLFNLTITSAFFAVIANRAHKYLSTFEEKLKMVELKLHDIKESVLLLKENISKL